MTEIDWAGLLVEEDVEGLWNGLFQLVCRHPAVRPLHFATDGAAGSAHCSRPARDSAALGRMPPTTTNRRAEVDLPRRQSRRWLVCKLITRSTSRMSPRRTRVQLL